MMQTPEEVTLINFDPNSNSDGIWYLAHTLPELQSARADSKEEKRLIAPDHYKIDAVLGSPNILSTQPDLTVTCDLTFHTLQDGVRMLKLDLMPDLQVSRVAFNGVDVPFVQEARNHDGSFYLQMPEALAKGRTYNATFEYAGGEIVQSKFFPVPPRRIWYPTPSGPAGRATCDLTFHIPQGSKIATVGNQVGQARHGFWDMSQWTSDVPIVQAVFRWVRDASLKAEVEESTKVRMAVYNATPPGPIGPPSSDYMLGDVGSALRLFTSWFGKSAYDNISVLVGGLGASLPGLVYVPAVFMSGSAALSSRVGMDLRPQVRATLDEGFPRLVAGQWWENTLTPASFHDAWLSAGLEGFSASVHDLATGNNVFKDRWDTARESLLSKNRFGVRPIDAGSLWMGLLNDTQITPAAGAILNASKGAYVVQMLRAMMWDPQTLDRDFQAMMKDFVASFTNRSVSTEDFESIVGKHMKPSMDLNGDGTMDWFFAEWLDGMEVPDYRVEYSLRPVEGGGTLVEGKLTQSGVSPAFRMPVPVFAELAGKTYRICVVPMRGNSTSEFKASLSARPAKILLNANHDILSEKDEVIVGRAILSPADDLR